MQFDSPGKAKKQRRKEKQPTNEEEKNTDSSRRLNVLATITYWKYKVPNERNLNPIFMYLKTLNPGKHFLVTDTKLICSKRYHL